MWKPYFVTLLVCGYLSLVSSKIDTSPPNGYSTGYLSDCPGVEKPAIIKQSHLRKLTITALGDGGMFGKRNKYTYYQTKKIVNDPYVDFKNKPTFIFCPGYMDFGVNWHLGLSIGAHYKNKGYNVLILDIKEFSIMEFPKAVRLIRPLSYNIAEMISNLTLTGLHPKNLTVLGVSLGGQTISFIAKNYRKLTGQKVAQLTSLDPTGPCFRHLGPEDRIDKTDADFVEVINTNIDGFGFGSPVGHVNFYINGGEYQPLDAVFWYPCELLCSHIKVVPFWVAAIEHPDGFVGIKCDSVQQARERNCYKNEPMITNVMGPKTDRSKEGIFFVPTTNKYPYFMSKKGMKKENDFVDQQFKEANKDDMMIF